MPYSPGSAIKGVVAAYTAEIYGKAEIRWEKAGSAYRKLFGGPDVKPKANQKKQSALAGAVDFLDAWWVPEKDGKSPFVKDIVNPHQSTYMKGGGPPSESENPIPFQFLNVIGCFLFAFRSQPDLQPLVSRLVEEALGEKGVGRKTRIGYGRFSKLRSPQTKLFSNHLVKIVFNSLTPEQRAEKVESWSQEPDYEEYLKPRLLADLKSQPDLPTGIWLDETLRLKKSLKSIRDWDGLKHLLKKELPGLNQENKTAELRAEIAGRLKEVSNNKKIAERLAQLNEWLHDFPGIETGPDLPAPLSHSSEKQVASQKAVVPEDCPTTPAEFSVWYEAHKAGLSIPELVAIKKEHGSKIGNKLKNEIQKYIDTRRK
jgi:CRISPR type III-B/RAMP module RAMP protein Cmr6